MDSFYFKGKFSDEIIITDKNEISHLVKSMRKKIGDEIHIINGMGQKYSGTIFGISKKAVVVKLGKEIVDDTEYDLELTIAISLLNKTSKLKFIVEKLTELGVANIIFFISERTVFPNLKIKDLNLNSIVALKQCGGKKIVNIPEIFNFENICKLSGFDKKYLCDFSTVKENIDFKKGKYLVVIGPEGGFSDSEREKFRYNGFVPLTLNKRILRAETAAIVAASKFLT